MTQLTSDHIKEFQTEGYTILHEALSPAELTMLHEEADLLGDYAMNTGYDLVRHLGCIIEPLECGYLEPPRTGGAYKTNMQAYKNHRDQLTPGVAEFLMTTVSRWAGDLLHGPPSTNGTDRSLYLLNEQYIIKPPRTPIISQFAWHRDADYYQDKEWENELTVACWIALDDVDDDNGTVLIGSEGKGDDATQVKQIVEALAGSVVFMSSRLAHKSSGNASSHFRRAFMPQYSSRPFLDRTSSLPLALAIPIHF